MNELPAVWGLPINGYLRESVTAWAAAQGYAELRLVAMTREFEVETPALMAADLVLTIEIVPTDDADYVLHQRIYLARGRGDWPVVGVVEED